MALQMIARFDTAGFGAWKEAFDAESESLGQAGLSVLQIWQEPDSPDRAWVLLRVNDRDKARAWTEGDAVAMADRAGISNQTHTFLKTV